MNPHPYTNLSREEKDEILGAARAEYIAAQIKVDEYYTTMRRCGLSATEIEEALKTAIVERLK